MADATYFAVKSTGDDNVEKIYIAKVVSAYSPSTSLSANAPADVKATVTALEAMLAGATVAVIPPGTIGNEGQLIS